MKWVVKMYDLRGFMFAYNSFNTEADARKCAAVFKMNRAVVVRVPK